MTEAAPDLIVIDDLRVTTSIGVHDFEHEAPQTVRFDIEVETVPGYAAIAIGTDDYVSYADIVEFIEDKARQGHVRLVEEWAESVAEFALRHPLAAAVTVRVLKTEIFANAAGVGIRIVRRKP